MDTKVLTDASVRALVDHYIAARREVDVLPDALERQIGLAALRIESQQTLDQAATTARVQSAETLAPLRDFVAHSRGGEQLEKALAETNDKAAAAAGTLGKYVLTGIFTGVWAWPAAASVIAALLSFAGVLQSLGNAISGIAFVSGGLWIFGRLIASAAQGAANAADGSWTWATGLGSAADRTLAGARTEQRRVWSEIGGRASGGSSIANKLRLRAQLGVGFLIAVSLACVVMVGAGFIEGLNERATPTLPGGGLTFTPRVP